MYSVSDDEPDSRFGDAVAAVGDVDLDGLPDFAVGAPSSQGSDPDPGDPRPGMAFVYSGATGQLIHSWEGPDVACEAGGACYSTSFGTSVASAGDANRDGVGDIAVGAPLAGTTEPKGKAYVFSGTDGALLRSWTIAEPQIEPFHYRFGARVLGAGDLDGDGNDDLVVSATGFPPYYGTIYAYSGATSEELWNVPGDSLASEWGYVIEGVADLNGDGGREIAVGARVHAGNLGKVDLLSGANGALVGRIEGDEQGQNFGIGLGVLDDLDGDNVRDLVVGTGCTSGPSDVFVHSTLTGARLRTMNSGVPNDCAGTLIAGLTDFNGDGEPDIAVNSSDDVLIFSGDDASLLRRIDNVSATAVSAVGDLNEDGLSELLVGSDGKVTVYTIGPTFSCAASPSAARPGSWKNAASALLPFLSVLVLNVVPSRPRANLRGNG